MIEVVTPGLLTTVQDLGRRGLAHLGVPPSGAADIGSFAHANRLVGNPPEAAALEATLVGPTLLFHADALVAVAGRVVEVAAGETIDVGPVLSGVRAYLAVAGGIDIAPVLGSRSTDLLTGLGPPPLAAGQLLPVGMPSSRPLPLDPRPALPASATLRVVLGPRHDWFTGAALRLFLASPYTVSSSSNRIGVRLEGPALERALTDELLSEGVVTGAVQVPPSGRPILLGPDHPTTGGYPVIAVVVEDDLPLAGQLRPGTTVEFRESPTPSGV